MAKKCPECGMGWPDIYKGCPYCIVRLLNDSGGKTKVKIKSKAEVEKDLKLKKEVVKKDPAQPTVRKYEPKGPKERRKKPPSFKTGIRGKIGKQIEAFAEVSNE